MEDTEQIRNELKKQQNYFKEKYNLKVSVYGTSRQGYKSLSEFMDKGSSILYPRDFCYKCGSKILKIRKKMECPNCYIQYFKKDGVYKKAHEYWTFLMILEYVLKELNLHPYEKEEMLLYSPTQGTLYSESALAAFTNYSIFVEPALCEYDKESLFQDYKSKLGNILFKKPRSHIKPDFLILKGMHENIGIPPISQNWLKTEFIAKSQEEYIRIKPYIKLIIECKNEKITQLDISQFIWYAIAYKSPIVLISQLELSHFAPILENAVETLNTEGLICKVIENFKIGEKEYCLNKIHDLFA